MLFYQTENISCCWKLPRLQLLAQISKKHKEAFCRQSQVNITDDLTWPEAEPIAVSADKGEVRYSKSAADILRGLISLYC